jgi:hypothetical protein
MKDKYIPGLIMSAIESEIGSWDITQIEYEDGTRNAPTVEQVKAVRLSALRELLEDIFKE